MAGATPKKAVSNFIRPLRRALTCVIPNAFLNCRGGYTPGLVHAVTLEGGDPVRVQDAYDRGLAIRVTHHYRIVETDGPRGPWKTSTAAYFYALEDLDEHQIFAYHWHPEGQSNITTPHLHMGPGSETARREFDKKHFPTGRIALEEFLRFVITEFDVTPQRDDWDELLEGTQGDFEDWRTWPAAKR